MSYVIFLWEILTLCFAWFKKRFSTLHNTKKDGASKQRRPVIFNITFRKPTPGVRPL